MPANAPATWDAVLEAALDCIIVMDANGIVREFNPAAQQTFGYTRADAVGKTLSKLIVPPELRTRHEEGLRRYLATGEGPVLRKRIEIEGVRSDGTRLPVELAIVPFDIDGERLFAGYLRDLTKARRAAALAELLHSIPLAAAQATSLDDAILTSLRAVCGFTGWPVGHAFRREGNVLVSTGLWHGGEGFGEFRDVTGALRLRHGEGLPGRIWATRAPLWVHDIAADRAFVRASTAQRHGLAAAFGLPVTVGMDVELVLEFYTLRQAAPDAELLRVLDLVGRELGRVVQRLRDTEALRTTNERLQAVADSRRRLLSQAAHELGTPITSLALQTRLLRTSPEGPTQARLEVMERNVQRLSTLARDLLDAARVESARIVLEPQPCDLRDVVAASVEGLAEVAASKGVALRTELASVPAVADPGRLGQVADNLVSNAIRFTPEGGQVEVRLWHAEGVAHMVVRDDGIGIEPALISNLFQPFSQVHAGAVAGGTGLGLFITKGIVEAHGGSVVARSEGLGRGAEFEAVLPVEPKRARPA